METGAISPLSAAEGISKVIVPPVAGAPRVMDGGSGPAASAAVGSGVQIGGTNGVPALPRGVGPDGIGRILDVFG